MRLERPVTVRRMLYAVMVLLFWTVFGVLSAGQIFIRESSGGAALSPWSVFNIVYFYWAWAIATPVALRLARVVSGGGEQWTARVAQGLPLGLAVLGVQGACYAIFTILETRQPWSALPTLIGGVLVRHLAGNLLTGVMIVAAYASFAYYRRVQDRLLKTSELALRASEMETTLVRMRLDALKTQLQPHFLFNTLNMVSGLIARGDAVTANRAVARLGDLLRASLSTSADQQVSLASELELTRQYLEIARLRFGDRLTITEQVEDAALPVMVPSLVLQPLVENAVQHAAASRGGAGRIALTASCTDGELVVRVVDDGPGFEGGAVPVMGVGLSNVRDRLLQLYGPAARLDLANGPAGGACVTLRRPLPPAGGTALVPSAAARVSVP